MPEYDGTLITCVYRKPTLLDQYLHWDSHHHIRAKCSVINTLKHRAKADSSTPELLRTEKQHIMKVLTNCKCQAWVLDRMECKNFQKGKPKNTSNKNNSKNHNNKHKGYIFIPCIRHLCKCIKGICGKYNINKHFICNRTIKKILVLPKDKEPV